MILLKTIFPEKAGPLSPNMVKSPKNENVSKSHGIELELGWNWAGIGLELVQVVSI